MDMLLDYPEYAIGYSIGVLVFGLFTHKAIKWFRPKDTEDEPLQSNSQNGLLADMILPSKCVKRRTSIFQTGSHSSIVSITEPPTSSSWRPVLVFANKKSGANQGDIVLRQCRRLLNPIQVHDLNDNDPSLTLMLSRFLPGTQFVIVICGGDGTVNWILTVIDSLNLPIQPLIAVMPIGTGNDLSNMLGWGYTFHDDSVEEFLTALRDASTIMIDRWRIDIRPSRRSFMSLADYTKQIFITNYFSIGCDALTALKFHEERERKPGIFTARILNRVFYAGYIVMDTLEKNCKNLHRETELFLDNEKVDLPELEGIMFLNIPFWGGGCQIWDEKLQNASQWKSLDPCDGKIEVIGLSSSFHMAQILAHMAEPIRLGQAEQVKLIIKCHVPAQSDGEPWQQEPCCIEIEPGKKVKLMRRATDN